MTRYKKQDSGPAALALVLIVALAPAASASSAVVVIGTGNPSIDVPAVQAAVDGGGTVRLKGTFSFDVPPVDGRTILVTSGVTIEGVPDDAGNMALIVGGLKPFSVNTPGAPVSFRGLRFVNAELTAIEILAADGVAIEYCRIEAVVPVFASAVGSNLAIGVALGVFTAGGVMGEISIAHNHFHIGGTENDRTEAIVAIAIGRADQPAEVRIADNSLRNTTAHGVDLRNIIGRVHVERNDVRTGAVGGQMVAQGDRFVDGIRVLGGGTYVIAHNRIAVGYENAAGIRLQGGPAAAIADAVVFGNDITMDSPPGAAFGSESAGIELRRAGADNSVLSNRINGSARAAIALVADLGTAPRSTTFVGNNVSTFAASLADLLIGAGVIDTTVIGGHGTVVDQGVGTAIKGGYITP